MEEIPIRIHRLYYLQLHACEGHYLNWVTRVPYTLNYVIQRHQLYPAYILDRQVYNVRDSMHVFTNFGKNPIIELR